VCELDGLFPGQIVKFLEGIANEGKVLFVSDIWGVVFFVCLGHVCKLFHREVAGVSDGAKFWDKGRFLKEKEKRKKERKKDANETNAVQEQREGKLQQYLQRCAGCSSRCHGRRDVP